MHRSNHSSTQNSQIMRLFSSLRSRFSSSQTLPCSASADSRSSRFSCISVPAVAVLFFGLMTALSSCVPADSPSTLSEAEVAAETAVLADLLDEFLADVSAGDETIHERFWAEDLIYSSSDGTRFGKDAIVGDADAGESEDADAEGADDSSEEAQEDADEEVTYRAEEVDIRLYDDVAVVAFRLIGETIEADGDVTRQDYFNTGTFLKRDGTWSVIAWHATKTDTPD